MIFTLKQRFIRALQSWRAEFLILIAIAVCAAIGAFTPFQDKLNDFAFSIVKRPASGEIVIIQIDAKSLEAIDTWPWPRSRHAELLEKTLATGAALIGLDIAFSSPSTATEDARLARAIQSAPGRVVLTSFVQPTVTGAGAELTETNPLPAFRNGPLIGNANVFAPNGVARTASVGLYLPDGRYRPTFAGLVGHSGIGFINEFNIDFGIDLKTIKRLSFVDVLRGDFRAETLKGKRVLVGATAIELGDRVPVPIHGVIAGVELQALAAESMLQGRTLIPTGFFGALLGALAIVLLLRPGRAEWSARKFGAPVAACAAVVAAGPLLVLAIAPILIEGAPAFAALAACAFCVGAREFGARATAVLRERTSANIRRAMITMIVEESSDGVLVSGANGQVELINERAAHLLNGTRSTMLGRVVPAHLPRFAEIAPAAGSDPALRHTELSVDCDGGRSTLDVSVRRLTLSANETGQQPQIDVYTLRDVTMQRLAADAERRAQDEKFMAERAKSNFIANMSHELRTPLNAIIGFSEMMARESLGPIGTPAYIEYSEVVSRSGHHLLALINNVLEISRIDQNATSVEIETLGFAESVAPCISFMHGLRDYKGQPIMVVAGGDLRFDSDPRLIKYVLINLLSNAMKFSGQGSAITVSARAVGGDFMFEIADEGTGIDPSLMPHLTELFYQTDRSFTRKHDGMGVGLYLVKRHVDLLKGSLQIESTPGQGTTVRVILPGAARPVVAAAA